MTEPSYTRQDTLSALEVALRIERKLDKITEDHEERLRAVERGSIIVRGAWLTIGVIASVIAGSAGLVIGVLGVLGK